MTVTNFFVFTSALELLILALNNSTFSTCKVCVDDSFKIFVIDVVQVAFNMTGEAL